MYCPKCGTQNSDDANFCMKCGENFKKLKPITSEKFSVDQVSQDISKKQINLLNKNTFFVKNIGIFDQAYEVLDSTTRQLIGTVREEKISNFFIKLLSYTSLRKQIPFIVDIFDADGQNLTSLKRGFVIFRSSIEVFDANKQKIGRYRQSSLFRGKFEVFDYNGQLVAMLQGNSKGWNFISKGDKGLEFVKVTKKYNGFFKPDSYVVETQLKAMASI